MSRNDPFLNGVYNEDFLGENVRNLIRYKAFRELDDDYNEEIGYEFFSSDDSFFDGGID